MQNNITVYNRVLDSLSSKEQLLKFLDYQAKMNSYTLSNTILLYDSNPKATLCATLEQWESIGKKVFKNSEGILVNLNNVKTTVFDINQTFGTGKIKTYGKIKVQEQVEKELKKRYISISDNLLMDIADNNNHDFMLRNGIKDSSGKLLNLSNQVAVYCISQRFDTNFELPEQTIKALINNKRTLETVLGIANSSIKAMTKEINDIIKGVDIDERREIHDQRGIQPEISGRDNSELSETKPVGRTSLQIHGGTSRVENGKIDTHGETGGTSTGATGNGIQQVLDIYGGTETKESSEAGVENVRVNTVQLSDRRTGQRNGSSGVTQLNLNESRSSDEDIEKGKKAVEEYLKLKEKNSDKIIGVQVGKLLMFFEDDAKVVAEALNKKVEHRKLPTLGETNVIGDYITNIEYVAQQLLDKGKSFYFVGEENGQYNLIKEHSANIYPDLVDDKPNRDFGVSKNYHIDRNFKYETKIEKRYQNNVIAIKTLKILEEENRTATKTEQEMLAQYVGWGGMPQVFNENAWTQEFYELKTLLSEEEYKQAKGSVINSFYTQPIIVKMMYRAIKEFGITGGNLLEPAMGTGNFIGMMPEDVNFNVTGIELDSITGKIAKALYPQEKLYINGFEKVSLADDSYDVAVGNVPFGNYKLYEPRYADNNFLIHDHFFAKAIDKVKPNGVIAFITSKGTLDKKDNSVRKYLCERAELIGAIRLPNTAFKNVNTEVTSDIIFLKKRESIEYGKIENWVDIDNNADGIPMNKYFIENPHMMCGTMVETTNAFGIDYTLKADNRTLEEALNETVRRLPKEIIESKSNSILENINGTEQEELNLNDFKVGEFALSKNQIYQRKEHSFILVDDLSQDEANRIKKIIEVKIALRECLNKQLEGCSDEELEVIQKNLNDVYDRITAEIGALSSVKNRKVFYDDPEYILLTSLELIDEETKEVSKAKIFTERTIRITPEITHVDTSNEALTVSLNQKGYVDIFFMAELTGLQPQEIIDELHGIIFKNPEMHEKGLYEGYETADEYLTGNVRQKLKEAEKAVQEDIRYTINIEKLKAVQPKELLAGDIDVRLGASWIPKEDIMDFIKETLNPPAYANIGVSYIRVIAEWKIEGNVGFGDVVSTKTYGTERMSAYELLEQALNLKTPTVYDLKEEKKYVVNKVQTMAAREKQDKIKNKFKTWIFQEPERRERLVQKYNEEYNSTIARTYDGSHLDFKGMAYNISLRPHQKNGVARILYGKTGTLLAHCVGAGKTWTITAGAMELKRIGLANKILVVVPNHLTEQWGKEWLQAYPSANILVATKKDFAKENRKKFSSKIATGNYDAIIIGHSSFGKIDVTNETKEKHIRKEIDAIEEAILKLLEDDTNKATRIIKRLETTKKNLEANLEEQLSIEKDDTVYFEQLGIDKIFVDEAHEFKNLYIHTKMNNVAGVSQTKSKKAADLYMKINYLNEISPNKNNIIFATGTPISNSMAEMFTMQRYLQGEVLNSKGLGHFDAWASDFGEATASFEVAPDGSGFRSKTRFSKFINLPELMTLYRLSADIQTPNMLNLPTPALKNGKPTIVKIPASDELKEFIKEDLMKRSQRIKDGGVDPRDDNMLKVTNDGRKVAIDMRLYDEAYEEKENCKISRVAENIYEIWDRTKEQKSTQLVFCDLSTPNKDKFNVYDELKKKLVESGINEKEIKYIHEANTDLQKDALFKDVRSGKIRVLIGSTAKMGAGTNVQNKLVALHHIDVPWRPSDIEQREGRILRQGNENKEVEIFRYVTEGSFDAYSWQTIETKQKFISQVMSGDTTIRSIDDLDESTLNYAEIKAIATGNPLILKKMEVDTEVARLKVLESQYVNQKYQLQDSINKYLPRDISNLENVLRKLKTDVEFIKLPKSTDTFHMVVNGIKFDKRADAGQYILEECFAKMQPNTKLENVGEFAGLKFDIEKDYMKEGNIVIKGALNYKIEIKTGLGSITRMENILEGITERIQKTSINLDEHKRQLELAKDEVQRPFEYEEKMKELLIKQKSINRELDLSTKEKQTNQERNKESER